MTELLAAPVGSGLRRVLRREDFVSGAITAAAILIFVGTAGQTLRQSLHGLLAAGGGASHVAVVALLLNVALLLIAWGRHREAQQAMKQRVAAEASAKLLRTRDLQTQLLNRQSLRERCGALIEAARGERGNVALIVINLDRFKRVKEL